MMLLDRFERITRGFLCGDYGQQKKMHTISWEKICRPLEEGGLGFHKLNDMNRVALAKLARRFSQEENKLWVRVLKMKYEGLRTSGLGNNYSALSHT